MYTMQRRSPFILLACWALFFMPQYGHAQAQLMETCELHPYEEGQHDAWFFLLAGVRDAQFRFDEQGGTLQRFDDGSAHITGRLVRIDNPLWVLDADVWLINERDWSAWSALGRTYKASWGSQAAADEHHEDWTYWELDGSRSILTGPRGSFFEGDTLFLSHRPSNYDVGFQLGIGANDKTPAYGFSGWYMYTGAYEGYGDFNNVPACEDPAPVCELQNLQVSTTCTSDSTFGVEVRFEGTGEAFRISDDQGSTPLEGLAAGTYSFGTYANGTEVVVEVQDASVENCGLSAAAITDDCTPPPTCDLAITAATAACISDTTFELAITFSGSGEAYELTDNQGSAPQTGLAAGSYTLGPYPSGTQVVVSVGDARLADCALSTEQLSADCAPPPSCELENLNVVANCNSDSTFALTVSFAGAGTYTLSDDQGTPARTGLGAGTYTFGTYPSDTPVRIRVADASDADCALTSEITRATCVPPPPCDLEILSAATECTSDSTFQVRVTFAGTGSAFRISDNQGSPQLTGLAAGTYAFGNYPNDAVVILAVSNAAVEGCGDIVLGLTENCEPPCFLEGLEAEASCLTDSTFEVRATFTGTGSGYVLSDNQASPPLSGLVAGTYTFGPYPNGTAVTLTVADSANARCQLVSDVLSEDCAPEKPCDLEILALTPTCLSGQAYEVSITLAGTGNQFTLTDDQGSMPLTGLSAGTYVFGPYPSQAVVVFTATDPEAENCQLLEAVSIDCTLPPPVNDLCANALPIACGDVVEGRTDGAVEVDVCGYCGTFPEAVGVWYEFIGQGDSVTVEVCGDYNTKLGAYEFGCDTLACVEGNDDAELDTTCTGSSAMTFFAEAGEPYLIYVNGKEGQVGTFTLRVRCPGTSVQGRLQASLAEEAVEVRWELGDTRSLRYVRLQRSEDTEAFEQLCELDCSRLLTRSHTYLDEAVVENQRYYYRLAYEFEQGPESYSSWVGVWVPAASGIELGDVYPNPVRHRAQLNVFTPKPAQGRWVLRDQLGNVFAQASFQLQAGSQPLDLEVPRLPEGTYLLVVEANGRWIGSRKLTLAR